MEVRIRDKENILLFKLSGLAASNFVRSINLTMVKEVEALKPKHKAYKFLEDTKMTVGRDNNGEMILYLWKGTQIIIDKS